MLIKDLFQKDIKRSINGVVKVDDLADTWLELEEFVVTKELSGHIRDFFEAYSEGLRHQTDKVGVWVSGFFGSGKSHFIKVLAYLLRNDLHTNGRTSQRAVSFFDHKIQDALLLADIKRVAEFSQDVVLFNIDSKADHSKGGDLLLQVFIKVLNEAAGYSSDFPHIASIERYLDREGKLEAFYAAYRRISGKDWLGYREEWSFYLDEFARALSDVLGQSVDSCANLISNAEERFPQTIEHFCENVLSFLNRKGPAHRIIFLVDEIGQFVGQDTQRMLNLQTITENLGTKCHGRAWLVVTSQEDVDTALGGVINAKAYDFSKIQGRFPTRLSLSSANVDEVIQARLLAKRPDIRGMLEGEFKEKGDILRNQISFRDVGMTLPSYADTSDFVRNYPFVSYHFRLLQKIFEEVRKAGATGLHLSQGERSLLDAFQKACNPVVDHPVGVLVPLYRFYPAIESFLDTPVKLTVKHAAKDSALEAFDAKLLQTLFLIRYVTEVRGNVDNLVTLCLDEIDAPRLALQQKVEAGLKRLEAQTLISRNGNLYTFLTNEEQEIHHRIKHTQISNTEVVRSMGQLIFEDVYKDRRKHRYSLNKVDFPFNRDLDGHPYKNRVDGNLTVSVLSGSANGTDNDDINNSTQDGGIVIVRLGETEDFERELKVYLCTNKYLRTKDDSILAASTRRFHREIAESNRGRRNRLVNQLASLIGEATLFVAGDLFVPGRQDALGALEEALEHLIANTFSKMGYIDPYIKEPLQRAITLLKRLANGETVLAGTEDETNLRALEDVRNHIKLCGQINQKIVLGGLLDSRSRRPYGWPEGETLLLLSRLVTKEEVTFLEDGTTVSLMHLADAFKKHHQRKALVVRYRRRIDPKLIKNARALGQTLFVKIGPENARSLDAFLRSHLANWQNEFRAFPGRQDDRYPGGPEITKTLDCIGHVLQAPEGEAFFKRFIKAESTLIESKNTLTNLGHFYGHQRHLWDKLLTSLEKFRLNDLQLRENDDANSSLTRLWEICKDPEPYAKIKELPILLDTVDRVNDRLVSERREAALAKISEAQRIIEEKIASAGPKCKYLRTECLSPLWRLKSGVEQETSIAHIAQLEAVSDNRLHVSKRSIKDCAASRIVKPSTRTTNGNKGHRPPPIIEPRPVVHTIYPSHLVQSELKTTTEADTFVESLKNEILKAIDAGNHVKIR